MAVSAILKRAVTMTETCKTAGTDYVPISCALHSGYELAILRRQWLCLVWADDNSTGNVIHDELVLPLDLKTANGEEFLVCRTKDGVTQDIRLDHVRRMTAA